MCRQIDLFSNHESIELQNSSYLWQWAYYKRLSVVKRYEYAPLIHGYETALFGNYQLLFTGLVTPGIDGFELAEHAHKHCEK